MILDNKQDENILVKKTKIKRLKIFKTTFALLGISGAIGLFFLAFYIVLVYQTFSEFTSIAELTATIFVLSSLTIISALVIIFGSLTIIKGGWKGGVINILVGTIIPIPTYIYFAFFSQLKLYTDWLVPVGPFILILPIISGGMSLILLKFE